MLRPDLDHPFSPPTTPSRALVTPWERRRPRAERHPVRSPDEGTELRGSGKTTLREAADVGGFRETPSSNARPRQPLGSAPLPAGGSAAESGTGPRAALPPPDGRSAAPPGGRELHCGPWRMTLGNPVPPWLGLALLSWNLRSSTVRDRNSRLQRHEPERWAGVAKLCPESQTL